MGTVTNDELSVEAQQTAVGQGSRFTPEEIAALLERWRPEVLYSRRGLWRGASPAEREDQLQDVTLILCSREFDTAPRRVGKPDRRDAAQGASN